MANVHQKVNYPDNSDDNIRQDILPSDRDIQTTICVELGLRWQRPLLNGSLFLLTVLLFCPSEARTNCISS